MAVTGTLMARLKGQFRRDRSESGSPSRTRTYSLAVNSHYKKVR